MVGTRLLKYRKSVELASSRLERRARVVKMKNLATKFCREHCFDGDNCNSFQKYYIEQKLIYPWLKKESLRWHVRNLKKKTVADNTLVNKTASSREPNSQVSSLRN